MRNYQLHLFDVQLTPPPNPDGTIPPPRKGGESDRMRPGMEIVPPVSIEGLGKIGLEICYDIRYVVLWWSSRLSGTVRSYDIALNPNTLGSPNYTSS